jgi:hypothetical protein
MNLVIAGMAETIVGKEDWTQYGPLIMKQRGWKNSKSCPIVLTNFIQKASKMIMAKVPMSICFQFIMIL